MHIMLDLETMGTRPNAPIIAIGAVGFEFHRQHKDGEVQMGGIYREFYDGIDLSGAVRDGAVMDPETVIWWLKQSEDARTAITRRGVEPRVALDRFTEWVNSMSVEGVWGNGAGFDNVILSETYAIVGRRAPWNFWRDRCYRTLKATFPHIEAQRSGVHHNALDDAKTQALHLIEIDKALGGIL